MSKTRPIKTLLLSTLFPSSARPRHGIFVENRLKELLRSGRVLTKVIAPVPWFPFRSARFGEYSKFAATPTQDYRGGVDVYHPRYFLLPKVGMTMAPASIARAALPVARKIIDSGFDFDLIDAHYYYPDGVAAASVAKALGKPFVVTARGSDLSLIPQYAAPRRMIVETAQHASASIGVCRALTDRLADLGANPEKLHVFRNGVDLERFRPEQRHLARNRLSLPQDKTIFLSVGHLVENKGHHVAVEAVAAMPQALLCIIGEGPEQGTLRALAGRLGIADRVRFVGAVDNVDLRWWYSASNTLVLCSSREGWANVLLESMACGTPVIATDIWGTPEVVAAPEAGVLMQARTPQALVAAYHQLQSRTIRDGATRSYAEGFSWAATTANQIALFEKIVFA